VNKLAPAVLALCVTFVGSFEGLRYYAYKDPVGVPTICFGYTSGVKMGDTATLEQCRGLLAEELRKANAAVTRCIHTPLTDNQRAALVSLVYNVGPRAVCGSTIQKHLERGDTQAACRGILAWKYSRGIILPGIVRRREAEMNLCLGAPSV
jgi:lysozyme